MSREYGELTDKELQFREKSWRQLYEVGLKCATWDNVPPYFAGNFERNNREGGYLDHIPQVVEIGTGKTIPQAALGIGTANKGGAAKKLVQKVMAEIALPKISGAG